LAQSAHATINSTLTLPLTALVITVSIKIVPYRGYLRKRPQRQRKRRPGQSEPVPPRFNRDTPQPPPQPEETVTALPLHETYKDLGTAPPAPAAPVPTTPPPPFYRYSQN
jgi:hypothetical protein